MSDKILDFHEKTLKDFEIPKWMVVKCPYCQKDLPLRSIRSVSMCFNTRNLGDIALEVFCPHCSIMDTLYFKGEANKISDFIGILKGEKALQSKPVLEEVMYKMAYNNVMERMSINGVL
jgi:phage FluMu protein Com